MWNKAALKMDIFNLNMTQHIGLEEFLQEISVLFVDTGT